MDLLRIIAAILLPPLGVFLQVGVGKHFWINILLTILGYIPGIVHAIWVIAKYGDEAISVRFSGHAKEGETWRENRLPRKRNQRPRGLRPHRATRGAMRLTMDSFGCLGARCLK